MKRILKNTMLLLALFTTSGVGALSSGDLSQLSANPVGGDELYMQVLINIPSGESADIYFSYGTSENDLSSQTESVSKEGGFHVVSEFVKGLQSGTTYYYRAHANDIQTSIRSAATFTQTNTLPGIEESSGGAIDDDQNQFLNNPLSFLNNDDESEEGSDEGATGVSDDSDVEGTEGDSPTNIYSEEPVSSEVHDEAVYFDDGEGEVLEYSDEYKNRFNNPQKKSSGGWLLFLVLLLLGVIGFLLYKMKTKKGSSPRYTRNQRLHQYRRQAQKGYVDSRDYFRNPEAAPTPQSDRFRSPGEKQPEAPIHQNNPTFADNRNEASFTQNTGVNQVLPGAETYTVPQVANQSDRTVFRPRPRK